MSNEQTNDTRKSFGDFSFSYFKTLVTDCYAWDRWMKRAPLNARIETLRQAGATDEQIKGLIEIWEAWKVYRRRNVGNDFGE